MNGTSNNVKWIIGALITFNILLITYLILKELNIIEFNFADCFSVASNVVSIVLSIVAILYTFYVNRDTSQNNHSIQTIINTIDKQVSEINNITKYNAEILNNLSETRKQAKKINDNILKLKNHEFNENDRDQVINTIDDASKSMLSFLDLMNEKK